MNFKTVWFSKICDNIENFYQSFFLSFKNATIFNPILSEPYKILRLFFAEIMVSYLSKILPITFFIKQSKFFNINVSIDEF